MFSFHVFQPSPFFFGWLGVGVRGNNYRDVVKSMLLIETETGSSVFLGAHRNGQNTKGGFG